MDEPTAALDPIAECLVFDRGQVVQRGSHEKLAGEEGLYRELWNAQAQYYQ